MLMNILPKTKLGKWSVGLIIAFFALLLFTAIVVIGLLNQDGSQVNVNKTLVSVPVLCAVLSAVAAFITGILSIRKHKERSILVFASTAIGLLLILYQIISLF